MGSSSVPGGGGNEAGLNCPVCQVPPIDAQGFEQAGSVDFEGTSFNVFQCWSCTVRFAVGIGPLDEQQDSDL